jgi:outer membrane lipoprotein LolB
LILRSREWPGEGRLAVIPALLVLLIAGCATPPARQTTLLDAAALENWRAEGRVGVATASDGFNASVEWSQEGQDSSVRLAGPMGAGALTMKFGDRVLRVETSRGQVLEGAQAEAAMHDQLGFAPPLEALRYWLLGLKAPGADALEERGPQGQLLWLSQFGWRVDYQEFAPQDRTKGIQPGMVALPKRLSATREDLRLRVVIDRWRLDR